MSRLLLLHHLGLGDHFMCHGIVREYAGRYEHVTIFSYPHNLSSVTFMFRDLPNLDIVQINSVDEAKSYIGSHRADYDEVKVIGFENLDRESGVQLEKQFYDAAGIPLQKKWESFSVVRDHEKEQAAYERYAPEGPYAFLHEDPSRKYLIKRRYVARGLPILVPDPKIAENVFDYLACIERAEEIHVIDSSFMFLIDCLPYENPSQKLFVHRYARENNDWQLPILRKDWTVITAQPGILDPLRRFLERLYRLNVFPFTTVFFKRCVRWFFRHMLWTMGRSEELRMEPIIRRYAPVRTFAEIGNDRYVEEARAAGATTAAKASLPGAGADVVLFEGDPTPVLADLDRATGTILILVGRFPGDLESRLAGAGFAVRERHLFSGDSCLICRAV